MMNDSIDKKKIAGSFLWRFSENILSKTVNFILQIVLARILLPEDYGVIAIVTVFITISQLIVDSGFTSALIQKKEITQLECSTAFMFSFILSIIIYAILFFCAPIIANYYNNTALNSIIKVQSLVIVLGALTNVPNALLQRGLNFRLSLIKSVIAAVFNGVIGLLLALTGFGVWSLVISMLSYYIVSLIVLYYMTKWHPSMCFSFSSFKKMFSYSINVMLSNITNTAFNSLISLIIGKNFGPLSLGYFNRGNQIPYFIMGNIDAAMTTVLFSALSKTQNDIFKFKLWLRRSIKTSMFVVAPVLIGLIVVAKPLTISLLTEKWLPSVPYIQLSCLVCLTWPLAAKTHAYNALGKSRITLVMNISSKIFSLVAMLFAQKYGLYAFVFTYALTSWIFLIPEAFVCKKILKYTFAEQISDIISPLLISTLMAIIIYPISFLTMNIIFTILVQVIVGIIIYIGFAFLFKIESFFYVLETLKTIILKR